jgi:hypothetical protein
VWRDGEDGHHVTGRDAKETYVDPTFKAPLCHSCHELVGEDWNTIGVQDASAAETFLDSLELRLTRTASFIGRVAEPGPEPFRTFLLALAVHLAAWATRLHEVIAALDQYLPAWRTTPGI